MLHAENNRANLNLSKPCLTVCIYTMQKVDIAKRVCSIICTPGISWPKKTQEQTKTKDNKKEENIDGTDGNTY